MPSTEYDVYSGTHACEDIDITINEVRAARGNKENLNARITSDVSDLSTAIATKANSADVTSALALKADTSSVNSALAEKADSDDMAAALALKADTSSVESALALKANQSDFSTLSGEVTNARTGVDGTNYQSLKARLDGENEALAGSIDAQTDLIDDLSRLVGISSVSISGDRLESGYYSSVDGSKQDSSSYVRSKTLYPIDGGCFYKSGTAAQVRACLYDKSKTFISDIYFNAANTASKRTIVPANAAYCGLFAGSSSTEITIEKMDNSEAAYFGYPYDSSCDYAEGKWINGNGEIGNNASLSLLSLYNIPVGAKYYVSNDATYNCICFNASGEMLTVPVETTAPDGKIFTIPSGTVVAYFNIYDTTNFVERLSNTEKEVFDARTGANNTKYASLKARLDAENESLSQAITNNSLEIGEIGLKIGSDVISLGSDDIESGYYSSVDGSKQSSSSYKRSKRLYPVYGGFFYRSETDAQVQACLYDKDGQFISRIYFNPEHTSSKRTIVPSNARYVGLTVASTETEIKAMKLDSSKFTCAVHPFTNPDIDEAFGYWINGSGAISASQNFILISLYNVKAGDKYYVSNDATYNGICFNAAGEILEVTKETVSPYGKIFTIPAGTVVVYFNLYATTTKGVNAEYAEYVAKITKPEKILCIGDSVTWLDGRGTYGGSTHLMGYQRILRQHGYDVRSAGFSGYPYSEGIHDSGSDKYSIYNEIVNKEYDVTGYDIILLVGGLNDISLGSTIGTRCTDYEADTFDTDTFNGSLCGIIRYIRESNITAKIILCTTLKSEDSARIWTRSKPVNDEIHYNAEFWSCYLLDLFEKINIQPKCGQFSTFFYDLTHPNWNGFGRMGELILNAVENVKTPE